ncbi:MAG: hypothetical protein KDI19_03785 [Pseudomonadales bacterium]|nr:hypothetical protein [Pseudomonadales bacterium]
MRSFAEFVMRGRMQAVWVCLLTGALPVFNVVPAAVVALVMLRRGAVEGTMLLGLSALPLAGWVYAYEDTGPILVLFGTGIAAAILRATMSWELTLAWAAIAGGISSLVFQFAVPDAVTELVSSYKEVVQMMHREITDNEARQALLGFYGVGQAYTIVLLTVLARWWQSMLYNPGGFQQEFHRLRLSPALSSVLVLGIAAIVLMSNPAFSRWLLLLTVPLVVSGIALLHWVVKQRELSRSWLVTFYLLFFLMMQFMYPIMTSVGLLDSWMNVRARLERKSDDEE